MSNQADYLKVQELVIKPLERHYGKPFDTETIADYVDDFARYDSEVLKKAMADVRQTYTKQTRPAPGVIFDAIRKNQGEKSYSGESNWLDQHRAEETKKATRALAAAGDYLQAFIRENDYRLKALPDFSRSAVINCVHESALFQAKIINGVQKIGYNAQNAIGFPKGNWEERVKWWLEMCRKHAATGIIHVETPWAWFEQQQEIAA